MAAQAVCPRHIHAMRKMSEPMTDREPFAKVEIKNGVYCLVAGGEELYTTRDDEEVYRDASNVNAAFNKRLDEEIAKAIREGKP